jgi:hypothetical protein
MLREQQCVSVHFLATHLFHVRGISLVRHLSAAITQFSTMTLMQLLLLSTELMRVSVEQMVL